MSERAALLSSIGLLGEYCPSSRKKERLSGLEVGCMHLEPHEGYSIRCQGCQFMRPVPFVWNFNLVEEENSVGEDNLIPF